MKRIEAIIRPHKLEEVLQALAKSSAVGVTVLETVGFGRQMGHSEVYRGVEHEMGLVPKRMLVMFVTDDQVNDTVNLIREISQTGKFGDGKIAVTPVDGLLRIRTGEEGESAL